MSQDKLQVISRPIISVGGETSLSDPIEGTELDMSGFVPASDELDFSDLTPVEIPIEMGTGKFFLTPAQRKIRSISSHLSFQAIEMTQRVGEAIDALDAISGPGWLRHPIPAQSLRGIIARYRRREAEIVDTNYVELLLTQAQDLWESNVHDKWEEAKVKRLKALMAPYEAARMAYEAGRLEAALREGRPVPGGLLDIQLGGRTAFGIPDVHGNEWGWWRIWNTPLDDGMTLRQKFYDGDHVASLGDATHPDFEPYDHWAPSENIMNDIFEFARHRPNPLWYTPGNHDVLYGGGEDVPIKGDTLQGILFRDHLIEKRGLAYVRSAQTFIDRSPFFIRFMHGDEVIAAAAHSSIVYDGMTPEDAIMAPYDPILRKELTWNRPVKHDLNQPYEPSDVVAMRKKIGSPNTIFFSGHTDQQIASFYKVDDMPGHIIGQATAAYNDELAVLKITADSVEVININGTAALSGRNLREEFRNSQSRKGIFKLLDFMPRKRSRAKAVGGDPFNKPGGGGPFKYKQDPVEFSRAMSGRTAGGHSASSAREREDTMIPTKASGGGITPKGYWFGTITAKPLIVRVGGTTYEIFDKGVQGSAAKLFKQWDHYMAVMKDGEGKIAAHMPLSFGVNRFGPITIALLPDSKGGNTCSLALDYSSSSSIAQESEFTHKLRDGGMPRLTAHDDVDIGTRPTDIPRPARKSTHTPPPPPTEKPGGNGPCKFKQEASDFVGIVRSAPAAQPANDVLDDPEYPMEMSALACAGMLEGSMPGIDAMTVSAMLAVPHLRV